ncbi:unnamed protein product, partial [marine sediment metagenome]
NLQRNLKTKKLKREISTILPEEPEDMMAPQLRRKINSLGIVDHKDIRDNLKTLYPLLSTSEKYMLKIYVGKRVMSSKRLEE